MKRFKYDYYDVEVRGDCADSLKELGQVAISDAADRTRLYCMSALWTAVWVAGVVGDWVVQFRVCRKRRLQAGRRLKGW